MKPQFGEQPSPSHPHSQGIVADYLLNAGVGTKVFDYSRKGNIGDIEFGVTWEPGGLNFNGIKGRVNCGSNPSLNNIWDGGGTIIARIKVPSSDGGSSAPRFCSKRNSSNTLGWDITIRYEAGGKKEIQFTINWSGGVAGWKTPAKEFPIDEMAQIAITYNSDSSSNNPSFIVKGLPVPVTELAAPSGARTTDAAQDLIIGNKDVGNRGILGKYENLIIYDRILSDADILQYNFNTYARFERRPTRRIFFYPAPAPDPEPFLYDLRDPDIDPLGSPKTVESLTQPKQIDYLNPEKRITSLN